MAAASDLTTLAFIFKSLYEDRQVADMAMREHPGITIFEKKDGFTGADFKYAIKYGNPQGISGTFTTAQANASSSSGVQLTVYRRKKYGYITLDAEAMRASRDDKGAFLETVQTETDGVIEELGDSLAFDFYRDGSGNRGRRASLSTNTVTLSDPTDARNFKKGMTVIASANADGSSPRTGSTTIASLDEDAGTVTLTSAAALDSFADNDYLFRQGDPGTCMEGLATLVPVTVSGSDSFRGINRSVDRRRLAGTAIDDTATNLEENIGHLAVKIRTVGRSATVGLTNPVNFYEIVRRLDAKVVYDGGGMDAAIGFETVVIHTPAGAVRLISDPDCPTTRNYIGREGLYIKTLDPYVHVIRDDGRPQLRLSNADGVEIRLRSWLNTVHPTPASWGVCTTNVAS